MFLNDAPDTFNPDAANDDADDSPNVTGDYYGSTVSKKLQHPLKNAINISKIPTTPKTIKKTSLIIPDSDSKVDADDYSANDPNTAYNDAGSTDSKESPCSPRNSKLKYKLTPCQ